MILAAKIRTTHLNGEKVSDSGWCLSAKLRGWCWWHHSHEAGARVIQVGPLVLEVW